MRRRLCQALLNPGHFPRKNKKVQKNKRKRSNNENSDSDEEYLQSFKLLSLTPNHAKIAILTTEFIGATTLKGK
jgi:hypothetical protein